MDRYGRITEGPPSDLSPEWTAPVAETELEESYPERPLEADCIYYLRTGFCGYGSRCRFNHPRGHSAVGGSARPDGVEYPERIGQPLCQYFMKTGMCKFGATCKYHHPKQGGGPAIPATLNYYGYPLRPGEKECSYYIKTGQCKFGGRCKFHHPQPVSVHLPTQSQAPSITHVPSPIVYPSLQSPSVPSSQHYGVVVARPSLLPSSYIHSAYGPLLLPQGMVPFPSWGPYLTPVNPVASPSSQPSVGSGSLYGISQLSPSAPAYTGSYHTIPSVGPSSSSQREVFPERPGQPECQHYMRTGDCKFGSSCKYHHPPELIAPRASVVLGPMGLPLRPGAPQCTHFAQHGVCKFGPACKFDHSSGTLSYSPSASSLVDMPVAPYPVGSMIGTLAPSSSSSDLRPEFVSGSSKDSNSARASSSLSIASGSTGSIMSRSGPFSQSSVKPSSQSSGPFTSAV